MVMMDILVIRLQSLNKVLELICDLLINVKEFASELIKHIPMSEYETVLGRTDIFLQRNPLRMDSRNKILQDISQKQRNRR
jgi:hypothetical protein